jgi:coenzyme F420 biosynthesis associated uncharacterized protein
MAKLLEPSIASAVARRIAAVGAAVDSDSLVRLQRDLDRAVPYAERLVAEESRILPPPPVRWGLVDRATWAQTNIASMTSMLNPLVEKVARKLDAMPLAARMGQRAVVSIEVGVLLGYISRRVLGQYDLLVPESDRSLPLRRRRQDKPTLYFVGSNIIETERRYGFVPSDFALWVALHEVTHRFQFEGVPWLRERFLSLVRSYVDTVELDARGLAKRLAVAAGKLVSSATPAEERNPIYLLASDEQRVVLNDVQAFMAVVEGHGNYVMDAAGAKVIPSLTEMRGVFDKRREQVGYLQKVVGSAIGLEMKLRQYELGQRFCEAVVARAGPEALAQLWIGPEHLPSMDELKDPGQWLGRVAA